MTAAAVEPFLLENLDQDWAIPCSVKKPWGCGGNREAAWIAHLVACCPATPRTGLYCDPCKETILGWPDGIGCLGCGALYVPASLAFTSIERLNP